MKRQFWLGVGVSSAVALCTAGWMGSAPDRPGDDGGLGGLRAWLGSEDTATVLVLLVGDRAGVDEVRRSVAAERVLAATPDAFVLREGRVVAATPEAAGEPLTALGWTDRRIEIWSPRRVHDGVPRAESTDIGSDADGDLEPPTGLGQLAELAGKSTLSVGETLRALALLDGGA